MASVFIRKILVQLGGLAVLLDGVSPVVNLVVAEVVVGDGLKRRIGEVQREAAF